MSLFGSKYPTDWEEKTRTLEKTVYRNKIKIKLDNGEQMTFEADVFEDNYKKQVYRDIEDIKVVTGYSQPITKEVYGDWSAEIYEDEIVAKETENVEKHTYKYEVDYKKRKVKDKSYSPHISDWKWEVEILDVRQIDTE